MHTGDEPVLESQTDLNHNDVSTSTVTSSSPRQVDNSELQSFEHASIVSVDIHNPCLPDEEQLKMIEKLFPDDNLKIHHKVLCYKNNCSSLSESKFDHEWLTSKDLSYCSVTRLWNFVFVEGKGVYCLLCKKHNMKNKRNKSDKFAETPSTRFR